MPRRWRTNTETRQTTLIYITPTLKWILELRFICIFWREADDESKQKDSRS